MSWGISDNATEQEKIFSTFADNLGGMNSCGEISYSAYSQIFDMGRSMFESLETLNSKYRWHDLRKNPEDLPTSNMNVYIAYMWQESKKISYYLESFVEGEFLSPSDAEVIAWKYIEPVEEEKDDQD